MEKDNLDCGVTHKSKVSWNNAGKKDLCRTNGVDGRKPLAVTAQPVKLAALNQKHSKKAMPKGKKEIKSQILKKKKKKNSVDLYTFRMKLRTDEEWLIAHVT